MTYEEKLMRLEELRKLWKSAKTPADRKIIEIRASWLKKTLPKTLT